MVEDLDGYIRSSRLDALARRVGSPALINAYA